MEKHIKAYGAFVVMTLVTAIVVRPIVQKMNVPLLNQL